MESGAQPERPDSTAERWSQVREILETALAQEVSVRADFVRRACGPDHELRAEVEALLRGLDESSSFLQEPVFTLSGADDPLVGTSVGSWKLLRRIGDGGTASVYAAARSDREFRKIVAIKILKAGMGVEEILGRFRTERQILAALDHPNITRLLDGGSANGLPYLVMEYVEGIPITQYAAMHRLSVVERLELFRIVCSALSYAHQNLVVHRDIKPANILVTAQGVPKVLDFGIAKLLRPESSGYTLSLTSAQMRMMTPEYASPEQARGDPITTASDVYSLGVVLYELLSGRRPYRLKTGTSTEIERAICEWEPERPSLAAARSESVNSAEGSPEKLSRCLRGDLDAILLTALRKEPSRRYPTVDRFDEDISRHLQGLPVSASTDTWAYRARKFTARHKTEVFAAAVVILFLLVSSAVSVNFALRALRNERATLQIANFVLGDFDAALQSGSTSARKDSLDQMLATLNQLSPNAKLRPVLFKAYKKLGDLEGNIYENNLGDAAAQKQSYQHALALAKTPDEMVLISLSLGDVLYSSGDRSGALENYRKTERLLEQAVHRDLSQTQPWLDLSRVWFKIGLTQSQLGRDEDALDSTLHELELARQVARRFPAMEAFRREVALAEEHAGDMSLRTGNVPEALTHLDASLAIYQELLKMDPENAVRRRDVALGLFQVARALDQAGKRAQAERDYRASLKLINALTAEDPQNEQFQRDRNLVLNPLSQLLYREGYVTESRRLIEETLSSLQRMVNKPQPSPYDLHQYCWDLLTTPFRDLHKPVDSLRLARRAVELTNRTDPSVLHLLALALEENGNLEDATETDRRALSLYLAMQQPPAAGTKRAEIAANLARLQGELAAATQAANQKH